MFGNFEQWKSIAAKVVGYVGIAVGVLGIIPAAKWEELTAAVLSGNPQLMLGAAVATASLAYGWWKNTKPNITAAVAVLRPEVKMVVPTSLEADKLPTNVISESQEASIIEHTAAAAEPVATGRRK